MGWRIICIEEAIKINYKLNSLGVLYNEEMVWINIDEIDMVVIESQYCNITIRLLSELALKGISMIVCGDNHMPIGLFNSILDNQRTAKLIRKQCEWKNEIKQLVWREIVKQKILLQVAVLMKKNKKEKIDLLMFYYENVEVGDITNREGLAAKVYFHELFGLNFARERQSEDIINSSLNYMYQVLRSKISQEIISHGYNPSLGIFHCNEYNFFGLSDDLIEVYRPIVDKFVIDLIEEESPLYLTSSFKEKLLNLLYEEISFNKSRQKIIESIKLYVITITNVLTNQKMIDLKFPMFYE